MFANQGILEETATRKLMKRNIEAIIETIKTSTAFTPKDFIKISVYPTSVNHHQSVIKETRLEKKIKQRKIIPMKIQVKNFAMFIYKNPVYSIKSDSIYLGRLYLMMVQQ